MVHGYPAGRSTPATASSLADACRRGKWQAATCPGPNSRRIGSSPAQRSCASGQRIRKRQLDGGFIALAARPPADGYGAVMGRLRVVLADDNYLVRQGVAALLREVDTIELIDTVDSLDDLLRSVETNRPDAVLTDIRMPPSFSDEGIVAAKRIRADHPDTGVLVLSQFVEQEYALELLSDGVAGLGYLLKDRVSDLDELVRALETVARGGSALDPRVVEGLVAERAKTAKSPLTSLTAREREVLQAMATGLNNATIARKLHLSERAIEKHISAVFQKLGLVEETETNRRVMAVLAFLEASDT
ncbi:MAG TPA: response regulator transcription factor [Jatrophihabitantaceae bacterium]